MDDVIVIGAGMAGVTAARELSRQGLTVAVVEARDRTGGRIYSVRDFCGAPVEGGAEFVHTGDAEIWPEIHAAALAVRACPLARNSMFNLGGRTLWLPWRACCRNESVVLHDGCARTHLRPRDGTEPGLVQRRHHPDRRALCRSREGASTGVREDLPLRCVGPVPCEEALDFHLRQLPSALDVEWVVVPYSLSDRRLVERLCRHALGLRGGIRIGIGDNPSAYPTATNAQLVERAVHWIEESGRPLASPTEVRHRLGLSCTA
jgi:hypothetical protein